MLNKKLGTYGSSDLAGNFSGRQFLCGLTLGTRFFAEDGAGAGTGGAAGDGTGGAAAADGTAGDGSSGGDDGRVSIERRNFAPLAPDGDFNKVISMAKKYQQFEKNGWTEFAAEREALGENGHVFKAVLPQVLAKLDSFEKKALETPAAQRTGDQQQAVAEVKKEVKAAAAAAGETLTAAQVQKMIQDALNPAVEQARRGALSDFTSQDNLKRAQADEASALAKALDEAKLFGRKVKVDWGGTAEEQDVNRQAAETMLTKRCQDNRDRGIHPSDPQYQAKRFAPFTPAEVQTAQAQLEPFFKQWFTGLPGNGSGGQNGNGLLPAGLAGGSGGRAQATMPDNPQDQKSFLKARAAARQQGQSA